MEETAKTLTPQESLKLIEKFISNYRKNYRSDSFYFLLWGWLVVIASISHFIILRVMLSQENYTNINLFSALNWGLVVIIGLFLQYRYIRRRQIREVTRSHLDKVISVLWQTTGFAIFLSLLLSIKLGEYPTPFVLTVVGMATLITGRIIGFSPLKWGGIVFFLCAVFSSFVVSEYQLLINAVAITLGYIVPGYMLRRSK